MISFSWLRVIGVSCFRVFVVSCPLVAGFGASAAAQPSAGNAGNGKRLFMSYYCYSCHGTEGQGGAGPKILARASADPLIRYVRKPSGSNMPPYTSKVISDQDLVDINAYLQSIPASPSAKTIPLLQQ
jgi:mono/diheme cytochrome c family protein